MSDSNPAEAPQQRSMTLTQLVLFAWKELFRSREWILRTTYHNTAKMNQVPLEPTASLDQARETLAEHLPHIFPAGDLARDRMESRSVFAMRIFAAWNVLWLSLFPLGIAVGVAVARINAMPEKTLLGTIISLALAIGVFVLATVGGCFLLAATSRPFVAFVNWLLKTPQF